MKTLYDVLGVSRFCTQDELDQAYNAILKEQIALLDSNPSEPQASEIRFKIDAIRHAYSVLSDPVKRLEYNERITHAKIKDGKESFGIARTLFDALPKSTAFLLISILALVPIAYIISHHQLKKSEIAAGERLSSKALDSANLSIDHQVALEEEKLAMEKERLRHEIELLKMEQERLKQQQENEMKKLEYEKELRSREIELAKQAEDREDKRLEYQANAGTRVLDMEERKLNIMESEIKANRKVIDEYNNYLRIQRNIDQIRQTIDIQRDAAAARLGITREQYDQLLYEKNYYGREY